MPRFTLALLAVCFTAIQASAQNLTATYKPSADKLIADSLADTEGYSNPTYPCGHIGKRISGSQPLLKAIAWSAETIRKDGLANVRVQPVMVPHWCASRSPAGL